MASQREPGTPSPPTHDLPPLYVFNVEKTSPEVLGITEPFSCAATDHPDEPIADADAAAAALAGDIPQPILQAVEEEPHGFRCPRIPKRILLLLVLSSLAQNFSGSIMSLFVNMDLALGPVEVTEYWMYIGYTGWVLPAVGYAADKLVVLGERRRPLMLFGAVGNGVLHFLYCFVPWITASFGTLVAFSVVSNLLTMCIYVPLNGLLVEIGRHDAESEEESIARMGAVMSRAMIWRSTGSLAGAVIQTCLLVGFEVRPMLAVAGGWFFVLLPVMLWVPRPLFLRESLQQTNFYTRCVDVAKSLKKSFDWRDRRSDGFCFVLVLIFVFVYCMMPDGSSVYYNYLYGNFFFDSWFYSMNNCIGMLGSIVGAWVFSFWMDRRAQQEAKGKPRTSIFFIFVIGSCAWALGYGTNIMLCTGFITETLGISAEVFVPIDGFFVAAFVRFAFMPTLSMAAEHAPPRYEATAFEVFSVATMAGGTVSALITSRVAAAMHISRDDYSKVWLILLLSIICKLVPIPLAYFLPERRHDDVESEGEEAEGEGENDGKRMTEEATRRSQELENSLAPDLDDKFYHGYVMEQKAVAAKGTAEGCQLV